MVKISIIIPIYNAEKYLVNCINSTLNQDLSKEEYEIILVNDGSTDGSESIILKYIEEYNNIIYLKQENKGVSSARNLGLNIANGIYVTFIDSDDTINNNTLGAIIETAFRENIDLLYLNLSYFDKDGIFIGASGKVGFEGTIKEGFYHERRTFISTLYKKDIIKNINFIPGIIVGEDTVFNTMAQAKSIRCSYLSIPYYNYFQHATSASNTTNTEKVFSGCFIAITELENFKQQFFPIPNPVEVEYFDKVKLIFIQRMLEWNILPTLDKKRFLKTKLFLKENNLLYLQDNISRQFKFFNKSFFIFCTYNILKKNYNYFKLFIKKVNLLINLRIVLHNNYLFNKKIQ